MREIEKRKRLSDRDTHKLRKHPNMSHVSRQQCCQREALFLVEECTQRPRGKRP